MLRPPYLLDLLNCIRTRRAAWTRKCNYGKAWKGFEPTSRIRHWGQALQNLIWALSWNFCHQVQVLLSSSWFISFGQIKLSITLWLFAKVSKWPTYLRARLFKLKHAPGKLQAFHLQNSVSLVSTREPFAQVGSTMVPDGKLDCFLMGQPQALFHLFLFSIFKKPAGVELRLSE